MAGKSSIEWTDETWNPVRGCSRISAGCANCYAEVLAGRFSKPGAWGHTFAIYDDRGPRWTGKVELQRHLLDWPKSKRDPKRIFVNSTSDLFHEDLAPEDVFRVFRAMADAPQHTFQVLTKRAARMRELVPDIRSHLVDRLNHVWLGVSVEDQAAADSRIPDLLATPAAVRFLSVEPLLGPIDIRTALNLRNFERDYRKLVEQCEGGEDGLPSHLRWNGKTPGKIDWLIVGGESGRGARPAEIAWIRSLVEQAQAAGVAPFVKQLGTVLGGRDHHNIDTFPADLRVREFPRA